MRALVMFAVVVVLSACPGPAPVPDAGPTETDAGVDAGVVDACANPTDPVTRLLIAPVGAGVTVIRKTPTHPAFDGGLP